MARNRRRDAPPCSRSCRSSAEAAPRSGSSLLPRTASRALHVDGAGAVHHDLCDVRVAYERFDGSEAEDVVTDLLDDEGLLLHRERDPLFVEEFPEASVDELLEILIGQGGVVQLRSQGFDELALDPVADLGRPIWTIDLRQSFSQ